MANLRAAAGQVDLSPRPGLWMTGYAARITPARGVHDPIMARALWLDNGESALVIVSCDLLGLAPAAAAALRLRIARRAPIPAGNILICCTHTHSGPACMPMRGVMGRVDHTWLAEAGDRIVQLVIGLAADLKPARLSFAATTVAAIGFNRQAAGRATDEELSVLAVEAFDGESLATILAYATHAVVLGPDSLDYSADWPGAAAAAIASRRGGVGMVLQGACGDVDPLVQQERGWGQGTHDDAQQIGQRLAEEAAALLADAPRKSGVSLRVANASVAVALDRPPSPTELAEMTAAWERERTETTGAVEARTLAAMLDWAAELRQAMTRSAVPSSIAAAVSVAALDDIRLVGLPFEAYSDIALRIKKDLSPSRTVFAGYTNGLIGYCPTRRAKDEGGYGPAASARWFSGLLTPIGYGADDTLVREAASLARCL
jgi:hypothetical protein